MSGITHTFVSGVADGPDPSLVNPTDWNATHTVDSVAPTGLTGSTAVSRYVGATPRGAPITGAHLGGDWVTDQDGKRWTCTTAGTPGVWTQEPGTGGTPASTVTGPDAFGDPAVVGTSTDFSRADHDHGLPSAPAVPAAATSTPLIESGAGAVGTGTDYARDDHVHPAYGGGSLELTDGTHDITGVTRSPSPGGRWAARRRTPR